MTSYLKELFHDFMPTFFMIGIGALAGTFCFWSMVALHDATHPPTPPTIYGGTYQGENQ